MRKILTVLLLVFVFSSGKVFSQDIFIEYDKSMPRASYAAGKLKSALSEKGYVAGDAYRRGMTVIRLDVDSTDLGDEAWELTRKGKSIIISGGDERGMIYGALSLCESVRNGIKLNRIKPAGESPHFPLRAIKHNTPWYSYRPSSALDQHYETVRDLKYWEAFLDMMVENRFNSLSIFNLHPFVYMISPENFPEASPFSSAEMEEWK
ncbi:MAG: glycoside hydrolase family 20 zincin-like fold domain-containing protein, partial [Bacteroidales bacterium]|nr:glycoside hydrolase family 20 zincin-like fold domain-containing protein [Bacteroidales bacterium]